MTEFDPATAGWHPAYDTEGTGMDYALANIVQQSAMILDPGASASDVEGEELARHVRSFQRELRKLKSDGGEKAVGGTLLPFALRFGLVTGDEFPVARFAHDWVRTFGNLPGWRPA